MIYIDLDDCVCETCDGLVAYVRSHYDRDVTVADMTNYDLRISFNLDEETYRSFMHDFHETELFKLAETPNACAVIQRWMSDGLEPAIVTGRPTYSGAATREWLAAHGLGDIPMYHVDKYAKLFYECEDPLITPFPALKEMDIKFAIEDAPNAVRMICETQLCPFVIFNRPWNASYTPPESAPCHTRTTDWLAIDSSLRSNVEL